MSTHSRIGIQLEDDVVESIYCHYDGYYSNVGAILNSKYDHPDLVKQLIGLGNIQSLSDTIDETKLKVFNDLDELATKTTFNQTEWQEFNYIYDLKNKIWITRTYKDEWFRLTDVINNECSEEGLVPLYV